MLSITDNDSETGCTLRMEWDSVSEAVDGLTSQVRRASNTRMSSEAGEWWGSSMADNRTRSWFDHALANGDSDTLDRIDALRARIESSSPTFQREQKRRTRRRGLADGDEMDADRFLARNPMLWEKMERVPRSSRTITIACEVGALGGVRREQTLPRGAAVVALADWLSRSGYSVEIKAVWHSSGIYARDDSATGIGIITVKPARAPLDVAAIATSCCEIAFARCVLLRSRIIHAARRVSSGLGSTCPVPECALKALGIDVTAPSSILSEQAAIDWLEATVAKLAGEMHAEEQTY
jgi:hypothetical protein